MEAKSWGSQITNVSTDTVHVLKYCSAILEIWNFFMKKKMCKLGPCDILLLQIVYNSASRREFHESGHLCENCPCFTDDICHLLTHMFNVKSVTASCDVTTHVSVAVFVTSFFNVNFVQPSMYALLWNNLIQPITFFLPNL